MTITTGVQGHSHGTLGGGKATRNIASATLGPTIFFIITAA